MSTVRKVGPVGTTTRRTIIGAGAAASAALAFGAATARAGAPRSQERGAGEQLHGWFRDTYRSLEAMVSPESGLPADNIKLGGSGAPEQSENTSSTNIGCWLWSTVAAAGLGVISEREMHRRLDRAVTTIERMQRMHGFWLNWYETHTGEVLQEWPGSGSPVKPLLSTVDNGWLDVGLRVAQDADPRLRGRIGAMREDIDWSFFYAPFKEDDPDANPGHMHTGFWVDEDRLTPYFYGTLASETRVASYMGLGDGSVPGEHYWRMYRTFEPARDQEMPPAGGWTTRDGVRYFNGHYTYRGRKHVPGWGGSMFEALMPELFVPSAQWSPASWGVSLRHHAMGQRDHGLKDAEYGYWGFSPCNIPEGGYQEYGVQYFGISNSGYCSNTDRTYVPYGEPKPDPSAYTNGVVTPHAAFLTLMVIPRDAMANLRNLARDFASYEDGMGFYDSINVRTGTVSDRMLSLDQGMAAAALAQVLRPGLLQRPFRRGRFARNLKPLLSREDFGIS